MRCYLVRHAQTQWNADNRFQGRTNSPLSPAGQQQARRLAAHFTGRPLGGIYTSALGRTIETGRAIAAGAKLSPCIIEPDLAEMDLGVWEGMTPDEIDARFNGAFQTWRRSPSKVAIPEAEPVAQFRARARAAFDRIVSANQQHELLIVTHGGVIASLLADWLGADYDQLLHQLVLSNAGVTAVECSGVSRWILWVNATTHLIPERPGSPDREPVAEATGVSDVRAA